MRGILFFGGMKTVCCDDWQHQHVVCCCCCCGQVCCVKNDGNVVIEFVSDEVSSELIDCGSKKH